MRYIIILSILIPGLAWGTPTVRYTGNLPLQSVGGDNPEQCPLQASFNVNVYRTRTGYLLVARRSGLRMYLNKRGRIYKGAFNLPRIYTNSGIACDTAVAMNSGVFGYQTVSLGYGIAISCSDGENATCGFGGRLWRR